MRDLDSSTFPLNGRMLIEASAGTGKTYTISSLYLRLLLGRDPALSRPLLCNEILVLTFTIAATDELRSRIRDRVKLARDFFAGSANSEKDEFVSELVASSTDINRDRRLLSSALQTMDEASIFTIHGFCARVLGEQSFASGMLFDQSLDGDRDVMLQLAAEDCFRQLIMPLPTVSRSLALQLFKDPKQIVRAVKSFLFRHGLVYLPKQNSNSSQLEQLIADNAACKKIWLEENITQLLLDSNLKASKKTVKWLKADNANFIEDYCASEAFEPEYWEPWTQAELLESLKKTGSVLPKHRIFDLVDSIFERRNLITEFKSNLYHQVCQFLLEHMKSSKAEQGQLTLDDLLTEVHSAIHNPELKQTLRTQWPAAMIDEFQDTDDLQFEIFTSIYDQTESNTTLLFIGDPKQAIYNFRGADVFTYLNARQSTDESFSLGTNWRSTPLMIKAVNHLFDKPQVFGEKTPIDFEPVDSAAPNQSKTMTINGKPVAPISLVVDPEPHSGQYLPNLMNHAAEETVELLHLAQQGEALIEGKPITPGQIAFLVRSRRDASAARQALAKRGVRSVYVTQESVFLTETAEDLRLILEAVIDPTNESAIKAAMGSRLLQCNAAELHLLSQDWSALHLVMTEFQHYHHLWATLEVAPMIEQLMIKRRIPEKWLKQPDGERQITNLRHLAEILQHRSMSAPGMRRLLKWFQREKLAAETVAVEDRQLRLESDSNLVQIVTMHVSKGLEYDIVMIPYAGFGEPRGKSATPMFHVRDESAEVEQFGYRTAIDFSGAEENQRAAQQEDFDESMRLMYVALTRARFKCYLGLPLSRNIYQTPIAKLLELQKGDLSDTESHLGLLPSELFTINPLSCDHATTYTPNTDDTRYAEQRLMPEIKWSWRMHSYTGLTRLLSHSDVSHSILQPRPAYGDDDSQVTEIVEVEAAKSRFTFPRGAKVGIVLHSFMENLSFTATEASVRQEANKSLAKMGIEDEDEQWQDVLWHWFKDIVSTPLSIDFKLSDIAGNHRLDEMEFHFPISADQQLIQQLKDEKILPDHMEMKIPHLQGMMTGYIDLIVCHEDQFYLIDYKSNDLGPSQLSYTNEAVTEAVKHHHYDLQYLIYCVALNRYLMQRVVDYDFDQHFGGVRYLFLRGMDGSLLSGVFSDRPEFALISKLDKLLSGEALP